MRARSQNAVVPQLDGPQRTLAGGPVFHPPFTFVEPGCFAEHGYEGATVVKLEKATGRSRGAIFNYFGSKEELFVELAVEDTARMSELWVNEGLKAVVREVIELDPAWLDVYLELIRRVRTDGEFRARIDERPGGGHTGQPCPNRGGRKPSSVGYASAYTLLTRITSAT